MIFDRFLADLFSPEGEDSVDQEQDSVGGRQPRFDEALVGGAVAEGPSGEVAVGEHGGGQEQDGADQTEPHVLRRGELC